MVAITTLQKILLFGMCIIWGLGHTYLGYRLRGYCIFCLFTAAITIVTLLALTYSPHINFINVSLFMAPILLALVIYDLWRIVNKINNQPSSRYENISSISPESVVLIKCNRCGISNYDDFNFCYNCGIELQKRDNNN
jgi:hypothetical protein